MSAINEAIEELAKIGVKAQPFYKPRYDLDDVFNEMKRDLGAPIPKAYEGKRAAWFDGMMKFIINQQLQAGAAVPRVAEAEAKVKEIYENMINQGRVDFHLANPGEAKK